MTEGLKTPILLQNSIITKKCYEINIILLTLRWMFHDFASPDKLLAVNVIDLRIVIILFSYHMFSVLLR